MTPPPPPPPVGGPEAEARGKIDAAFEAAGWVLQNRDEMNLSAGVGVAVRDAQEIADDLRSALGQIEDILGDLEARVPKQAEA